MRKDRSIRARKYWYPRSCSCCDIRNKRGYRRSLRRAGVAIVAAALLSACASAPRPDPTPSHPFYGCIVATMNQQASVAGKIIPEPVRIIGEYDDDQWMVMRGAYDASACADLWDRERCQWLPMRKEAVRMVGCGMETDSMAEKR